MMGEQRNRAPVTCGVQCCHSTRQLGSCTAVQPRTQGKRGSPDYCERHSRRRLYPRVLSEQRPSLAAGATVLSLPATSPPYSFFFFQFRARDLVSIRRRPPCGFPGRAATRRRRPALAHGKEDPGPGSAVGFPAELHLLGSGYRHSV